MKTRELKQLGVPPGPILGKTVAAAVEAVRSGQAKNDVLDLVRQVVERPGDYLQHETFGEVAHMLQDLGDALARYVGREEPAPYRQWGSDLEPQSVQQMENACQLPVSVRGALMADAHLGYGLPIGGVLATRNAVIPYAVGVDIACRVKMTVLDVPVSELEDQRGQTRLAQAIECETRFGIGSYFKQKRQHEVMDADWSVSPVTGSVKDKAWKQLGSSGSGNHFVEFGELTIERGDVGLAPGIYLALLSHSGSRGAGAAVAKHYSDLAMRQRPELPQQLRHLAWLDLDTPEGQEYWQAMELMGQYASANHAMIHQHIARHLGAEVLLDVENHHNFAWKEVHYGEELVVHRKGATPAGEGDVGLIPGSMATASYMVRGKGSAESLNSASHGAGRVMSRTKAKKTLNWEDAQAWLKRQKVTLLSAGLDEVPMVYKNIDEVMAAQDDLVEILASFAPRIVKMAPSGEPPED